LSSVKVRFLDRPKIIESLKTIASQVLKDHSNVMEVVLFGSLATGKCAPGSDADIMLVLERDDRRFMDRIPEFARIFMEAPIPTDIFPYTAEEKNTMLFGGNPFLKRAWKERIVLAQREAAQD